MQILSRHGTEAAVYAGGTDLLIRLKNGLTQAPGYAGSLVSVPAGRLFLLAQRRVHLLRRHRRQQLLP